MCLFFLILFPLVNWWHGAKLKTLGYHKYFLSSHILDNHYIFWFSLLRSPKYFSLSCLLRCFIPSRSSIITIQYSFLCLWSCLSHPSFIPPFWHIKIIMSLFCFMFLYHPSPKSVSCFCFLVLNSYPHFISIPPTCLRRRSSSEWEYK